MAKKSEEGASTRAAQSQHTTVLLPAVGRVDALADICRHLGWSVHRYSLAGVTPTHSEGSVRAWLRALNHGRFDDVVFAAATTISRVFDTCRQEGCERETRAALATARLVARTREAAWALEQNGLPAKLTTQGETTRALIATLRRADFAGHRVSLELTAEDDALLVQRAAADAGAELEILAPRETDEGLSNLIDRVCHDSGATVVFTSALQVERLVEVALEEGRMAALQSALEGGHVVAVGGAGRALEAEALPMHVQVERGWVTTPSAAVVAQALVGERDAQGAAGPTQTDAGRKTLVIVGAGMTAQRLSELMREYDERNQYRVVVIGEEPRPPYDRVRLTSYMSGRSAKELALADRDWYLQRGVELRVSERVTSIHPESRRVVTSSGWETRYDALVLATGSSPFVPPIDGRERQGVFVYRTIEDLDAIRRYSKRARRAAVIGGGLLGLEAAKAVHDLGLETYVVEFAPRLMPRQLDDRGGRLLRDKVVELGVRVLTDKATRSIDGDDERVSGLTFSDGEQLEVDLVIISAGIRPREELARDAGLELGERGGIRVDDALATSAEGVYAVGECASHRGVVYGLVAPCYEMADVLACRISGKNADARFAGADTSTKLKLMGVDVASFGDVAVAESDGQSIAYEDLVNGVYKKVVVSRDKRRLLGGMLVGDSGDYARLFALCRSGEKLPCSPEELVLGTRQDAGEQQLADNALVCSCNNVTKGALCKRIREQGLTELTALKKATRAGTGCGGCVPLVSDLLGAELRAQGKRQKNQLCEHFPYSRQELFDIVRVQGHETFTDLLASHGSGDGCEVCKPTVASILASVHNALIVQQDTIQDTNDRYLANIQRTGLYSVVPRVAGGEITPDKLIVLGQVAKKYGLYTKITGGQRIDLFGARVDQLPDIWEELVAAGFESGHAYGKAMRTVKSCVGSSWCRFGVQDSVSLAIRIENRYKGIRSPHKLKSAVSGCVRECAEAQSKDFGIIATEKGWNVYVGGNGGAKPRHANLLVSDVGEEEVIRYLDRFVMYYIRTADKLMRTSVWLEKLEGGIEQLRRVLLEDSLGICEQLEADMQQLVDRYQCEWKSVVENPQLRARFKHFTNDDDGDPSIELVEERGQHRPRDWPSEPKSEDHRVVRLPIVRREWIDVGHVSDFPVDGGRSIRHGSAQVAVFNLTSRGTWHATQNRCPHMGDMVLARGIVGDAAGVPKVACPLHKKTFSLTDGSCLTGEEHQISTFPVRIAGDRVLVELPPSDQVEVPDSGHSQPCAHVATGS